MPNDADGNSAEYWGHTEAGDEDDGRAESHPHPYGRLLTNQYEEANRRYLMYHDRAIRRLEEAIRGPAASTPPPRGARVPVLWSATRWTQLAFHDMLGSIYFLDALGACPTAMRGAPPPP